MAEEKSEVYQYMISYTILIVLFSMFTREASQNQLWRPLISFVDI